MTAHPSLLAHPTLLAAFLLVILAQGWLVTRPLPFLLRLWAAVAFLRWTAMPILSEWACRNAVWAWNAKHHAWEWDYGWRGVLWSSSHYQGQLVEDFCALLCGFWAISMLFW